MTVHANVLVAGLDSVMVRALASTAVTEGAPVVVAFLNTHGGHLVIGVNDNGEALGLENDQFPNEDKMNLHLVNVLRQRIGAEHLVHVDIRFESIGDKRVLVVKCSPSQLPVYHRDGNTEQFFIRTGAATTELRPSEIQAYLRQRF